MSAHPVPQRAVSPLTGPPAADDVPLFFGMTPPRASSSAEKAERIASKTLDRLESVPVDGLLLYDLDDESDRTDAERPFPYFATMDPAAYLQEHLTGWEGSTVVYRSVGKYDRDQFTAWLDATPPRQAAVLVGASSSSQQMRTTLADAMKLCRSHRPDLALGGVAIPERHVSRADEHERLLAKQEAGASFFVTQIVYDVTAAKNLASDYAYACVERGVQPARLVFTLSLCGSVKTLNFLQWLGVNVPHWLENELAHARDPLGLSVMHALDTARELRAFCGHLGLPCGFNVESVSNRRSEIVAAIHVARHLTFALGGEAAGSRLIAGSGDLTPPGLTNGSA